MNRRRVSLAGVLFTAATLAASAARAQGQDPGHVVQGEGGLITALVLDPAAASTVYATTARGLYKTVDGGRTWLPYAEGLGKHSVLALAVDPASRGLFAATDTGGVFRSLDGAGKWSAANTGLATRWIGAVAFDPRSRGVVYAGTEAGRLFRSDNGGQEWTEMTAPIPQVALSAISVDPTDSNVLYVGTNSEGIFRTLDGGATWTRPTDRMKRGTVWNITIDPTNPSRVYVGTHDGLFKSSDRGATWTGITKGMKSYNVLALAVDPSHPDTLYAATAIGIYKSPDAGATWSLLQGDLYVSALVVDPRNPALLYAGTHMGVMKSVDGGSKWVSLDFARRDDPLTAVNGGSAPLPALPLRRNTPAVTGLKPLPVAPHPPATDVVAGQPGPKRLDAGGGRADGRIASAAAAALPARLSPVPVPRASLAATAPIEVTVAESRAVPERADVASTHPSVTKSGDAGTKRARELAQHRDAAVAAFETLTGRRPTAAHRSWTPITGVQAALPLAQPAHRLAPATQTAGPRAKPILSGGR